MTDPRLPEPVEKSEHSYKQVQNRITLLRRTGQVPYGWITDATRQGYFVDTFSGTADFLARVKGLYRADLWRDVDFYCEVWTESRSMAAVVHDDCQELAVSLYPAGGFASITLAYQAAEAIKECHDGRPVVILYIGDYDPAGVLIDQSLEQELRRHLGGGVELHFIRIGITTDQITKFNLPTKPRKETDRRSRHIDIAVEAEAMPAHIMRTLLRDAIEELLPKGALAVAQAAEESELAFIDGLVDLAKEIDEPLSDGGAA